MNVRKHKPPWSGANRTGLARAALFVLAATLLVCPLLGCGLFNQHARQMALMRGMAADTVGRLDQGAMAQAMASGEAINPGITAEAAVVYRVSAYFDGLAGQFGTASQGALGDRVLPAEILKILNDTSMSAEARQQAILGWLATQRASPANGQSQSETPNPAIETEKTSGKTGSTSAESVAPG